MRLGEQENKQKRPVPFFRLAKKKKKKFEIMTITDINTGGNPVKMNFAQCWNKILEPNPSGMVIGVRGTTCITYNCSSLL